jgi:hypothetical protein
MTQFHNALRSNFVVLESYMLPLERAKTTMFLWQLFTLQEGIFAFETVSLFTRPSSRLSRNYLRRSLLRGTFPGAASRQPRKMRNFLSMLDASEPTATESQPPKPFACERQLNIWTGPQWEERGWGE